MNLPQARPMPERERRALTRVTLLVWAGVLVWNVSHVQEHLGQHGTTGWRMWTLSFGPDILILVGVWKLRYDLRSSIGWLMTVLGIAWLGWAALSTAEPSVSGRVISVLPIVVVILLTLALEFEARTEPERAPEQEPERSERPAPKPRARTRTARAERPSTDPSDDPNARTLLPKDAPLTEPLGLPLGAAPTPVDGTPSVPSDPEATTPLPIRRKAPSREVAAEILGELVDLDSVSAAELGRRHGGSDVFWLDRKKEEAGRRLDRELAQIGAEAPVE